MIEINIPGYHHLKLVHLVLDYNGTLAIDGHLIPQVGEKLTELAHNLHIHMMTADTFGLAKTGLAGLPLDLTIASLKDQAATKLSFVSDLGVEQVVAIGNGRNDSPMLKAAALGIALVQQEGGTVETLISPDIVSGSILEALDLLSHPQRLVATLRASAHSCFCR